MDLRVRLCLAAVIACCTVTVAAAPARVAIPRWTAISWDDEGVTIMVRVEPHEHNRALVVAAIDADGFEVRRSLEALEGADAPITRWVTWRNLNAAGEVTVIAALFEQSDRPCCVTRVVVLVNARL